MQTLFFSNKFFQKEFITHIIKEQNLYLNIYLRTNLKYNYFSL